VDKTILLAHGSGGKLSHELVINSLLPALANPILEKLDDSAVFEINGRIAFTTDSFVVNPIFFPGGDIGKLSVCGTINDLAMVGARPLYLSLALIIEEGLPLKDLDRVMSSVHQMAEETGVKIVTGDTKVVNRTKCDKVFITTTGIGILDKKHREISSGRHIKPGDKLIINGSVGDHGMAVLAARKELNIQADILSDCASLNGLIQDILSESDGVKFMRDPTRGGLATVLAELARSKPYGISVDEAAVHILPKVKSFCELLGFDAMYVANEGKVLIVADSHESGKILEVMHRHELGKEANIIGEVVSGYPGKAWMETAVGGKRILDMLAGEQLPRIC